MTLQDYHVFQPFGFYELRRIPMDGGCKRPANTLEVSVDGLGVRLQQTIALDTGSRHSAASIAPCGETRRRTSRFSKMSQLNCLTFVNPAPRRHELSLMRFYLTGQGLIERTNSIGHGVLSGLAGQTACMDHHLAHPTESKQERIDT